ncbi:MAG TPA: phosphocholine cytidylyltransferase family protein [Blastocatellia bacterium]|nr:phosphocholine cytidylyltransferase family protein [Blastocatellia bacterium]
MKGIILAAGKGVRLNGATGDDPKCLLRVGEMTLIERQIRALQAEGINDIVAVVGFGADRVRQVCGPEITYVENSRYDRTNSLFSLWLARRLLQGGFVVMNADVLFHPQLLHDLLTARYPDALLVAYCDERTPLLGEEEMKVKVRAGKVVDVSKVMLPQEADGENVGIVKFGPEGAKLLASIMDTLIASGGERHWAPRAFLEFAALRPLYAIGTRGFPWIEIDFPEDYCRAVEEILPAMRAAAGEFGAAQQTAAVTGG